MSPRTSGGASRITVNYSFDFHSVLLSPRTLRRILAGAVLTLRGQGFFVEGVKEKDSWSFNATSPGSIRVETDEGREVFEGHLGDDEVWVEPTL